MSAYALPTLKITACPGGATLQDEGRRGWKRFGVSEGGAMDMTAWRLANELVGNLANEAALEIPRGRAVFRVLDDALLGVTGCNKIVGEGDWFARYFERGEEIVVEPSGRGGFWSYLTVAGGFHSQTFLSSRSMHCRVPVGTDLPSVGDILSRNLFLGSSFTTSRRRVVGLPVRTSSEEISIPVHRGPHFEIFSPEEQEKMFAADWTVSPTSDRVGYRLEGETIGQPDGQLHSEPVTPGTIQVLPSGQPLVLMRDGPTIGGYAQIGIIDRASLSLLSQAAPPVRIKFTLLA